MSSSDVACSRVNSEIPVLEEDLDWEAICKMKDEELCFVRKQVSQLREEKVLLCEQLKCAERELAVEKLKSSDLKSCLNIAQGIGILPESNVPLLAAPQEAPMVSNVDYDTEFCGSSLKVSDNLKIVTATHQYNKVCLTKPAFDARSEDGTYVEFILKEAFSKFVSVGLIMCTSLDALNVNTDSLGENATSFSWSSHPYWTASFLNKGESKGPKGGEWSIGSCIGILVQSGCVSFYLDGELRHQHVFKNLEGMFRFGVGFGGPQQNSKFGSIQIA